MSRNFLFWMVWIVGTVAVGGYLSAAMIYKGDRSLFLIGETTSGHHQIELACNACHTKGFSNIDTIQEACLSCHKAELKVSDDSHPLKKFRDPRNADRLEKLDVTKCVTCHTEHRPGLTQPMGLTMPKDYCFTCHEGIAKDRPETHSNLNFTSCASAGCHNYHDNRALYDRFLERHANEPDMKLTQLAMNFDMESLEEALGGLKRSAPLAVGDAKAPGEIKIDAALASEWHQDAHAQNGVNCAGCHQPGKKEDEGEGVAETVAWIEKPGRAVCASCHVQENKTFLMGKHGMRLGGAPGSDKGHYSSQDGPGLLGSWGLIKKTKLGPMKPEMARAAMKAEAHGRALTCTSCHGRPNTGGLQKGSVKKDGAIEGRSVKPMAGAHNFSTAKAKVEACVSCHDSDHTKSYLGSPHHQLWQKELAGVLPKGSGVTCATCHMPRQSVEDEWENEITIVNHNQNDNLRPNEKMIRTVCSSCHGLRFTIDALADPKLILNNFRDRPQIHIESIDWVLRRVPKEGDKN